MGKKVVFLPIWGKLNETIPVKQMEAIRQLGGQACYGVPGTFFPITRSCIRFRPDVVSLDWIHQYAVAPGVLASLVKSVAFFIDFHLATLLFGIRLVWTVHNLRHHDHRPRAIERWISSAFARRCKKIRVLGPGIKAQVSAFFGVSEEKIVEIPEGSFVGWYPEGITKTEARQALGIPENDRVWLYFGNLRPYKGVEDLIEAFVAMQPLPHTKLVLAGRPFSTAYAHMLEQQVAGQAGIIPLFRTIEDAELQTIFAAADLVVLPFKNVLNSGSAILAMGFGKPVIAPAVGLIPFRLQHQPDGFLFTAQNPLAQVLAKTNAMPAAQLQAIGDKNRSFVLSFAWTDFATMILAC